MNANTRTPDGTHLVVEFSDCEAGILNDPDKIESLLVQAVESIGATVVERVMHQFRPDGVTGCVISQDSHLTIHTWPQTGYASVDLYTCRDCDIQLANVVLSQGLCPQSTQTILVDRGMDNEEKLRIRGYRRVASYTLDLNAAKMPGTIYADRSPERGFGLFANQDFEIGDLIYDTPGTLAEWDSEFIVDHDAGRSVHSADSLGYELTPELVETWPQSLKNTILQFHELKTATSQKLLQCLTDDYECEVLITGFDGLKNHASDANTSLDWSGAKVSFNEDEEPLFDIPTRAIKPIRKGDELFVNYAETLFSFVPPSDWQS